VIVYDDGSDVPLAADEAITHLIRHESPKGPSVCRNLGAQRAMGDVLVFADAHTRTPDLREIAALALAQPVIVIPAMESLYPESLPAARGYGRNYILKGEGMELIGFDRSNAAPASRYVRAGGNWGGFFVMSRQTFERIGGWVDHAFWGYNDPSLILKAWLCGVDTICDTQALYQHKHKSKAKGGFGYPVKAVEPLLNVLHTYATVFETETLDGFLALFDEHHRWMMKRGREWIARAETQAERARFQALRTRNDEAFFKEFLPKRGFNLEVWPHA
jgi:glycosyltransferase involved in cell wall biosynthesis